MIEIDFLFFAFLNFSYYISNNNQQRKDTAKSSSNKELPPDTDEQNATTSFFSSGIIHNIQTRVSSLRSKISKSLLFAKPEDELRPSTTERDNLSRPSSSFNGGWINEDGGSWSPQIEDEHAGTETKIEDWVPIVDRTQSSSSKVHHHQEATTTTMDNNNNSPERRAEAKNKKNQKFIPLVDFNKGSAATEKASAATDADSKVTHIQKIPTVSPPRKDNEKSSSARTIMFPYAYERSKDSMSRYIPLVPEQDIATPRTIME